MKGVPFRLSKLKLTTIKLNYSPEYKNHIFNYIATNPLHPLSTLQQRRQQDRKKKDLWWHATNTTDLSKSGCVRTWARRRLAQAFKEELKAKGYDEKGKLVDATALQDRQDVMNVIRLGKSVDLNGSLRLHGISPLLSVKFEQIKDEVRTIVDALVTSAVDTALGFDSAGEKTSGLGLRFARVGNQRKLPRQQRKPVAAPASSVAHKKKAESGLVKAAKDLLEAKPQALSSALPPARSNLSWPREAGAAPAPLRTKPQAKPSEPKSRHKRPSMTVEET